MFRFLLAALVLWQTPGYADIKYRCELGGKDGAHTRDECLQEAAKYFQEKRYYNAQGKQLTVKGSPWTCKLHHEDAKCKISGGIDWLCNIPSDCSEIRFVKPGNPSAKRASDRQPTYACADANAELFYSYEDKALEAAYCRPKAAKRKSASHEVDEEGATDLAPVIDGR